MGIFNMFKKKPRFIDDTFGELTYTTFKDSAKNFYDGEVRFQKEIIGIIIEADEEGPTDKQKDFFKKINTEYITIKENIIIPFLKKELGDHIEEAGLNNFDSEFEFDAITIGQFKNESIEWSITYDFQPMRHYVSVNFVEMKPISMNIDG